MATATTCRLGLIGAGNMGAALLRGFLQHGLLRPQEVLICDVEPQRQQALAEELDVKTATARSLVQRCETVLLAVKPQSLPTLLEDLRDVLRPEQLVISIAAGVSLTWLRKLIGPNTPLVRVMPNLLCTVGESASAFVATPETTREQLQWVEALLGAVGLALPVEEKLLDAVTGLSGSGPAFAALFCEALADGGVAAGLPREMAVRLAAQTLVGTGQWILSQGAPAQLKDAVTSPQGTTIAGLEVLEREGVRGAVLQAVLAAARRSAELARDSDQS